MYNLLTIFSRSRSILFAMILVLTLPTVMRAEKFVLTTARTAQAQFAGYYVAQEKGFYRQAGLDVVIQHPSLLSSAFHQLQSDESNAAMFSMMSALDYIAQGIPLVNIFQDSMNSSHLLISRWNTSPLKMNGKKVAIFNSDPNYLAFIMSKKEGIGYEWVKFTSNINLFLSGAVDATMAASYNEYLQLLQSGFHLKEDMIYRFSEHGYNIQENGVYVKRDYFRTHREACRQFAEASRKGWEWAANHIDETVEIVMKYVYAAHIPTNRVMQKLMLKEVLNLQLDKESHRREFRIRPDMVERANRLMLECGMLRRKVTYKELMGHGEEESH